MPGLNDVDGDADQVDGMKDLDFTTDANPNVGDDGSNVDGVGDIQQQNNSSIPMTNGTTA